MKEIRCRKTMKYKVNLSTKLLFLQNVENALTTFLHSTDDYLVLASSFFKHALKKQIFNFNPIKIMWRKCYVQLV